MNVFCSYIVLLCEILFVHAVEFQCPPKIEPCECNANTASLICLSTDLATPLEIKEDKLTNITAAIKGDWGFLQIQNTNIKTLPENLFKDATFHKIFIVNNPILTSITSNVFGLATPLKTTIDVVITGNKKLSNIDFKFLSPFSLSLKNLEMQNNSISSIPPNSINGFDKLVNISFDSQNLNSTEFNIGEKAFGNLTSLRELDLSNNAKTKMAPNAIDLSNRTVAKNDLLIINLNASISDSNDLKNTSIKLNGDLQGDVLVFLNKNTLTLKDNWIDNLIKVSYVYLDADNTKCECKDVPNIAKMLRDRSSRIQSPYPGVMCKKVKDRDTRISDCLSE